MLRAFLALLSILLFAHPLTAQEEDSGPASQMIELASDEGKQATAVRIPNGSIDLDGALNEAIWTTAPAVTDFRQKEPVEGAAPTNRMEVHFVYDDEALYVGARMYSENPSAIQAPLGRRDDSDSAEHIIVSLDTFLDRRTAYSFGVTASGVRLDCYHSDDSDNCDSGFDPVWQAKTRIDAEGWTAELWIPYTQLRFNDQSRQVWGLNVLRFIPTLEEEDFWVMIPRTQRAWASRFGDLRGIEGIDPTMRLEVLPFVVGSTTMNATRDPADPFDDGRNLSSRFGADLKMGVGPNLTLDATINPDFGQVEADPAEVNLSAFETRFPERRPFFTEGSDLLNLNHPNVFYSRRIGSPPIRHASGDFVDEPATSRILGAAKLTGRLPSGTSIGILGALTDHEYAETYTLDSDHFDAVRVAPRSGYGVVKVRQEIGEAGSTVSALVAGVHRWMGDAGEDPLATLESRNALVYGTDGLLRLREGEYELAWAAVGSYVAGEAEAIERTQRASAHYLQRPDRDYAILDPTKTAFSGFSFQSTFDRVEGEHWLFGGYIKVDTPFYETTDIAQLTGADGIQPNISLTYRETQPNALVRNYSVRLSNNNEWNWGLNRQRGVLGTSVNVTWLNFWSTSMSLNREFRTESATLTRGGPVMGGPSGWQARLNVGNSSASKTRISGGLNLATDELGGWSRSANFNLSIRPAPRWELSARPSYSRSRDPQQYVTTLDGGRTATYGNRYIFSYIDRTTISTTLRMSFTLRPDLNFDLYAEPFAASGHYFRYGELTEPASLDRIEYGVSGGNVTVDDRGDRLVSIDGDTFTLRNRDFNVRDFNSNAVLRWEWKPGSTMYLVWQQSRSARETLDTAVGLQDAFRSITVPGTNILLFKTSWWLPVG